MNEPRKIGELEECKDCSYFEEPDIGCPKECTFPWLGDWTEEEASLMECQRGEGSR